MAVPKRKVSPSRKKMRRSHHALVLMRYVVDKDTGELHISHRATSTGFYKGRKVLFTREQYEAQKNEVQKKLKKS